MAKTIEIILRKVGYEFDTAHCGQEAIDLATENKYDLILLDIMLPDLDGYEVIERIREKGVETPFLVQTGIVGRGNSDDKASLGVTDCLIKPFNQKELIEGIEKVIKRSRMIGHSRKGQSDGAVDLTGTLETDSKVPTDYRRHRRFKSMKSAQVVRPDVFECKLLNVSYSGAALCLPNPEKFLSQNFGLAFDKTHVLDCEVCWRIGDKVGVKFV